MSTTKLNSQLETKLDESIIDKELTLSILSKYNRGEYDHFEPVVAESFPQVDNINIIDMGDSLSYRIEKSTLIQRLESYGLSVDDYAIPESGEISLSKDKLLEIGRDLMPLYAFGILNGGSATSYADSKKNSSFNPTLFDLVKSEFEVLANQSKGKAKGITPAFINPKGTPGPSFIELKMRALLISNSPTLFQMTSFFNNDSVLETYGEYKESPYLKDLIEYRENDICEAETGIQPLLSAFTHSKDGKEKSIFLNQEDELLPMPGGHGQCFVTLKDIFKKLHREGKRFISIGNVDNSGYTPDPFSLALLAISGKEAGFDFSFKTPVDVKGGVLVRDNKGHLNCADLGVAIEKSVVKEAEENGESILFNCATGLFNLDLLIENLDNIINSLPMRFSDQDKDAGQYSQAEQVTWEVIGLLDDILIFAVDKYDRFLAAKTIMENLMTSGVKLDDSLYPSELKETAANLNRGLEKKLRTVYGLELKEGEWQPIPASELEL